MLFAWLHASVHPKAVLQLLERCRFCAQTTRVDHRCLFVDADVMGWSVTAEPHMPRLVLCAAGRPRPGRVRLSEVDAKRA